MTVTLVNDLFGDNSNNEWNHKNMKNIRYIRSDFSRQFQEIIQEKGLASNIWNLPIPQDDSLLIKWKSDNLRKVLRLQEADEDETLQFGYAIGKSGLDFDYDDILLVTTASNEKTEAIFHIYQLWFVENESPAKMEETLKAYFHKYNP